MPPSPLWLPVLALATACVGHAGGGSAPPLAPAERAAIARELEGEWHGVVSGRELATSGHIADIAVRLTIDPDGRWTLTSGPAAATGVITAMTAGILELDGRIDGHHKRRTWLRVHRVRHDFLVGLVQTEITGSLVVTHVYLRRAPPRG
jgi:hypothetical protein